MAIDTRNNTLIDTVNAEQLPIRSGIVMTDSIAVASISGSTNYHMTMGQMANTPNLQGRRLSSPIFHAPCKTGGQMYRGVLTPAGSVGHTYTDPRTGILVADSTTNETYEIMRSGSVGLRTRVIETNQIRQSRGVDYTGAAAAPPLFTAINIGYISPLPSSTTGLTHILDPIKIFVNGGSVVGSHYVDFNAGVVSAGATFLAVLKASDGQYCSLSLLAGGGPIVATASFDLNRSAPLITADSNSYASIKALPDGWIVVKISTASNFTGSVTPRLYLHQTPNNVPFAAGSAAYGIYIGGVNLTNGQTGSSYIPTADDGSAAATDGGCSVSIASPAMSDTYNYFSVTANIDVFPRDIIAGTPDISFTDGTTTHLNVFLGAASDTITYNTQTHTDIFISKTHLADQFKLFIVQNLNGIFVYINKQLVSSINTQVIISAATDITLNNDQIISDIRLYDFDFSSNDISVF